MVLRKLLGHTGRRAIRRLLLGSAMVLTLLAGIVAMPTPANAAASGCTAAPYGYVCGGVSGTHKYINHAYVVRGKASWDMICNYQGLFTIYDQHGSAIYQHHTSRHNGCTPGRAWFDWYPRINFSNGVKECAAFYERDQRQGTVCFRLR